MNQVSVSQVSSLKETVGRYGIWSFGLRSEDPAGLTERAEAAAELEELGFGALWLGGSPGLRHAVPLVEATSRLVVATGIQSIWDYEAAETASGYAELEATHPGRFLLGLGVSHAGFAERYRRPYASMVEYLDVLDAAGQPAERRVLAALGPKMLELSRDRAAGSHPYLVTPEHTAQARAALGETAVAGTGVEGRTGRGSGPGPHDRPLHPRPLPDPAELHQQLPAHRLHRGRLHGRGQRPSDRRGVRAGDENRIRERIDAFHTAGADHVTLQLLGDWPREALPRDSWRRLADLLK